MRRLLMAVTVVGAAGVLTVALPARAKAAAPYPYAHAWAKPTAHAKDIADATSRPLTTNAAGRTAPAAA